MGQLVNGKWFTDEQLNGIDKQQYEKNDGHFKRSKAAFRHWVTKNGDPGPTGDAGFKAETGRYHLFAALNCPWAHRTLIYRNVKKLRDIIGLSVVAPARSDQGWVFDNAHPRFKDSLLGLDVIYKLYQQSDDQFTGRATVPVLWDTKQNTIVSNQSAEIIRMFNSAFNHISGDKKNFYPSHLAEQIDLLNDQIFQCVNNGVYKAGFARTQGAYADAVTKLFQMLDQLEQRLNSKRYLFGDAICEADWRLFPTLARFDVGYYSAFKCNIKAIRDYPNLSSYLKDLYRQPGIAETVDLDIYRNGYHSKSPMRNPLGIIPLGFSSQLVA